MAPPSDVLRKVLMKRLSEGWGVRNDFGRMGMEAS
jgi:hypothetical protein